MVGKFDLLGDPIPEGKGKRGRDGHIATKENASKIRLLLVAGLSVERIAAQIGISAPTLRKHYFSNGKVNHATAREMAISEARAKVMLQLGHEADRGSVSAMKALMPMIDKAEIDLLEKRFGKRDGAAKAPPPGRKAQQELEGMDADDALQADLAREADATRVH